MIFGRNLIVLSVFPSWLHSASWGYGPSGLAGTTLIIVVILLVPGKP
ncbi:MAG: DUF3309 family protein [Methylocella sp.]